MAQTQAQKDLALSGAKSLGFGSIKEVGKATKSVDPMLASFNQQMVKSNPVTILSSNGGKRQNKKNQESLLNMEANIGGVQLDVQQGGISGETEIGLSKEEVTKRILSARKPSGLSSSPAVTRMEENINRAEEEGTIGGDQLANLRASESSALEAIAKASTAKDDPVALDAGIKSAQDLTKKYIDNLTTYNRNIETLREERKRLAVPGTREKELSKSANNIKTEIDQIQLTNERRKFEEFKGQTLGFAQKRGRAFDVETNFRVMERRLALQNVLGELGIEQGARELEGKSAEQALEDFQEDFELQQQMDERIFGIEQDVIDRAEELGKEAQDDLFTIMDTIGAVNPEELDPKSLTKLEDLALKAGLPIELVMDAMKATYQRQVFEDNIETERATRKVVGDRFTPSETRDLERSGFINSAEDAQNFFLSLSNAFKDFWIQQVAEGNLPRGTTIEILKRQFTAWERFEEDKKEKKKGTGRVI
jgi:hypothetical protein